MGKLTEKKAAYLKVVVRRMYGAQKLRIQSDLRMKDLVRKKIVPKEVIEEDFEEARKLEHKVEDEYEKVIHREIKDVDIYKRWLRRVQGIGNRLSGLLIANIYDPTRFRTVSSLWAYAGLHVIDGKAAHRKPGEKANWSNELKTTCYKIGSSFVKCRPVGKYEPLYRDYYKYLLMREVKKGNVIWKKETISSPWAVMTAPKSFIETEFIPTPEQVAQAKKDSQKTGKKQAPHPEWFAGRIHAMALRRTTKIFLSHLLQVWYELDGVPFPTEPFAFDKLGHEHKLDPWDFVKPE